MDLIGIIRRDEKMEIDRPTIPCLNRQSEVVLALDFQTFAVRRLPRGLALISLRVVAIRRRLNWTRGISALSRYVRLSDIARSLNLSWAQARQIHKAALLAKAVPVLIYSNSLSDEPDLWDIAGYRTAPNQRPAWQRLSLGLAKIPSCLTVFN